MDVKEADLPQNHDARVRKVDMMSSPENDIKPNARPKPTLIKERATLETVRATVERLIAEKDEHKNQELSKRRDRKHADEVTN